MLHRNIYLSKSNNREEFQIPRLKLVEDQENNLIGSWKSNRIPRPQLLRVLRFLGAIRAVPQTRHRVRSTPLQKAASILRTDERNDRPECAEIPGFLSGMQIELADIQEHHEIDDAPFHGEHEDWTDTECFYIFRRLDIWERETT